MTEEWTSLRTIGAFQKALNSEDVEQCRQIVEIMIANNYVQPLWADFCLRICPSTPDSEVLELIHDLKRITGWTCAPGWTPRGRAIPLDTLLTESGDTDAKSIAKSLEPNHIDVEDVSST